VAAIPVKPEYGPTLGKMLEPRWRRSGRGAKAAILAGGLAVLILIAAAVLTLEPARLSHGGSLPFSFTYSGLYREAPEPAGYARVAAHYPDGSIKYSFAVNPLVLPPYEGEASGAVPVYATGYWRHVEQRFPGLQRTGEGKTRVNKVPAYQVLYKVRIDGREMYGRNVLLAPERPGARRGVEIVMLTAAGASSEVKEPSEVASGGVLLRPLKTFSFG
jgi:hypothetical protein